jgi:hypothetical protein
LNPEEVGVLAKQDLSVKQAAEELGVTAKWIRKRIAEGTITPARRGSKHNGRFALTAEDVGALRKCLAAEAAPEAGSDAATDAIVAADSMVDADRATLLARIEELEADSTNLQAHVAWARAIAKEQQKALDLERERAQKLAEDLETQRARVEALKALSTIDRLLGRHKGI